MHFQRGEVQAEFARSKDFLPKKPAAVTFKQIVIAPQPSVAAKEVARVRAESLLAQLKSGSDFEKLAKLCDFAHPLGYRYDPTRTERAPDGLTVSASLVKPAP